MFYKDFEKIYHQIIADLSINFEDDEKASAVLNKVLQNKNMVPIEDLKQIIQYKEVFVFGSGPSLESSIKAHKEEFVDKIKITVDGATTALLENDILPDIIVTDLDGKVSDQIIANSKGSFVLIHCHGDNIEKIKEYVPKFKNNLLGTTQINPEPYENLHNFFGFTDGDRAVSLANYFGAKKIFLIGFDFNGEIGKYSFAENKDKTMKLKKLKWCKYIIETLQKENKNIAFI